MKVAPEEDIAWHLQAEGYEGTLRYTSEDATLYRITEPERHIEHAAVDWHEQTTWGESFAVTLGDRLPADIIASLKTIVLDAKKQTEHLDDLEILRLRDELPIMTAETDIVQAARNNSVTIVVAETGSGKSTQIPQMAYRAGLRKKIFHTSPRRAATRNIYEQTRRQVGAEYGHDEAGNLVSYQTAGDYEGPIDAPINMCTDGLELVRDIGKKKKSEELEDFLDMVVVVDEVHEWNTNIEVQLAYYKWIIREYPDTRIIISSATMDADRIARFFSDVCHGEVPIIEVSGRLFDVAKQEKPESTATEEALKNLRAELEDLHSTQDFAKDRDQLVFIAGKREIEDIIDELYGRMTSEELQQVVLLPLHAKLSVSEQQAAINRYPGKIKIVVSTNVAETSLTIPGIKYVVDTGEHRQMELDEGGVQGLVKRPISQAECDQRAGRAGRVSNGFYTLTRLNVESTYLPYIKREKFPVPEILRTDIVRHTLRIAAIGLDIAELELPHPVKPEVIRRSKETLMMLGALDENGRITKLGERMDELPVRPSLARSLVEASRYSEKTRAYMAAIAAAVEVGGIPYFAPDVDDRWKELTNENTSDLLAQLDLFISLQGADAKFMRDHDIDIQNVDRARELYWKLVRRTKASEDVLLPPTQEERDDLKRCIISGQIINIYRHIGDEKFLSIRGTDEPRTISSRSIVAGIPSLVVADPYRVEFVGKVKGKRVTQERHILERVTVASLGGLAAIGSHLATWESAGLAMRDGKFVDRRNLTLFGVDLGIREEVPAHASASLRQTIVEHVLSNPGSAQKDLRSIKKTLEGLAHLAKDPVPQLTHDEIKALVMEATPEGITDPAMVDMNLRNMIAQRGITLESYVTKERQDRIRQNAPATITIGDVTLKLKFNRSVPIAHHFRKLDIMHLKDEELFLPDGRVIMFLYGTDNTKPKRMTIHELRHKMGIE